MAAPGNRSQDRVSSIVIRDWRRIVRYGFVSGLTWVIDFVIFALLQEPAGYVAAMVFARVGGLAFGFPAHRWFSFSARGSATLREATAFLAVWLVNLDLATALLLALVRLELPHPLILKFVVEVVVFLTNFLVLRRVFVPRNGVD